MIRYLLTGNPNVHRLAQAGSGGGMTEATKQLMTLARRLEEAFAAGDIEKAKRVAAKQNAVIDAVMGNAGES